MIIRGMKIVFNILGLPVMESVPKEGAKAEK